MPSATRSARRGIVSTDHHLATAAGISMLARGGTAADAATAAAAVLAVVSPHASGLGGDLFAIVHRPGHRPRVLEAVGRAGSGADPERLRREGHDRMPAHGDPRSVTVPGCVDGWTTLHGAHGVLALSTVLEPAVDLADGGFPVGRELLAAASAVTSNGGIGELIGTEVGPGIARRPGTAEALRAIADGGRDRWYRTVLAPALLDLGRGQFSEDDIHAPIARWTDTIHVDAWGARIHAPPPPSQAYVTLIAAGLSERVPLPDDAMDPAHVDLLARALHHAARDRNDFLHEHAEPQQRLSPTQLDADARSMIDDRRLSGFPPSDGCTTYLAVVDRWGTAVSLIQSVASVFGSHLVLPGPGVVLHNRGRGFSLRAGHPSELGPGRRPPHTLAPVLVTDPDGRFRCAVGTRGADAQPQIVLQLLAHLLRHERSPAAALRASRWLMRGPDNVDAFRTWERPHDTVLSVEADAPRSWPAALESRGHRVSVSAPGDTAYGYAHIVAAGPGQLLEGAADPRAAIGTAMGW